MFMSGSPALSIMRRNGTDICDKKRLPEVSVGSQPAAFPMYAKETAMVSREAAWIVNTAEYLQHVSTAHDRT